MIAFLSLLHLAVASPYEGLAETVAKSSVDEYEVGRQYHALLAFQSGVSDDPELVARLGRIARTVVRSSERPDMLYQYQVLATDEANACALPGGFISVNRGLMERLTDAELAFVVAHEFAHVTLRHGMNGLNVEEALKQVARLQERRIDSTKSPEQGPDAGAIQQRLRRETLRMIREGILGVQRVHELEADLYGTLTATRAGFDPTNAVTALRKLEEADDRTMMIGSSGNSFEAEDALSTHPRTEQRVAEIEKLIARIQSVEAMFLEGVAAYDAGDHDEAARLFRMYLTAFPRSPSGWTSLGMSVLAPSINGSSLPYIDTLRLADRTSRGSLDPAVAEEARTAFLRALELDPTHAGAMTGLGVLARLDGDAVSAQTFMEAAIRISGRRPDLLINLGNALAQQGQVTQAVRLWREAGKDPAWLQLALLNETWSHELAGRKRRAIRGWKVLAGNPIYATRALKHLHDLGVASDQAAPSAQPSSPVTVVGGPALGTVLADVVAMLGVPEDTIDREREQVVVWQERGVKLRLRDGAVVHASYTEPGAWSLTSGVALGSPVAQVYAKFGAPDATVNTWLAHISVYSDEKIAFEFSEDKVSGIFLGSLE